MIDGEGCDVQDPGGIQGEIDVCEVVNANKKHGKFVRCVVTDVTRPAKKAGRITGREKGLIIKCAARSDIGIPGRSNKRRSR